MQPKPTTKKRHTESTLPYRLSAVFFSFLLAAPAYAVQYETLSNIPGLTGAGDLADYINALYRLAIMIGVTLSILIIAYAGFEYMTIDVVTEKKKAKTRITHAVLGLLMLLGTYVILYQLNPDIVSLRFGN